MASSRVNAENEPEHDEESNVLADMKTFEPGDDTFSNPFNCPSTLSLSSNIQRIFYDTFTYVLDSSKCTVSPPYPLLFPSTI